MIKTCNRCEVEKPLTEFYKHRFTKDGHEPSCKACKVEMAKIQRRGWKVEAIRMKGGACSVCGGIFHPCVYDFHHSAEDKEFSPGKAGSKTAFFREVDKCDLVCANCHRVLHHT